MFLHFINNTFFRNHVICFFGKVITAYTLFILSTIETKVTTYKMTRYKISRQHKWRRFCGLPVLWVLWVPGENCPAWWRQTNSHVDAGNRTRSPVVREQSINICAYLTSERVIIYRELLILIMRPRNVIRMTQIDGYMI